MSFLSAKASYQLWPNGETMAENMAPPKPPRGVLRKQLAPLADVINSCQGTPKSGTIKFSAIERRRQLIEEFRVKVDVTSIEETFNGREGFDAMIEVVMENSTEHVSDESAKERALKLLDMWLQEHVIRAEESTGKEWVDEYRSDKKVKYLFNPPHLYRVVLAPHPRSPSRERSPSRRGSFKRLFRLGSTDSESPRRTLFNDENKEEQVVETSRFMGKLANRLLSNEEPNLQDEARMFETALRCILLEIDVPIIDGVMNVKDCKDDESVSFMSTLLRRMGLGSESRAVNTQEVFNFIASCPHLKRSKDVVTAWFRCCFACAPSLHLERAHTLSDHSQIHDWAKLAIRGVTDNFMHITNHGRNPLIPVEFAPFLVAITERLCTRSLDTHKRARVLHLLWLMIPSRMRRHLNELLDLLQATAGTDSSFNFRDPFFVDKQSQELGENFYFLLQELRQFIVPQAITADKQMSIIQMYLHVRAERNLDSVPADLHSEMATKQQKPVKFCQSELETEDQAQKRVVTMVEGIMNTSQPPPDSTFAALKNMNLQSNAFTPQRKKEMIELCRNEHPEIMSTYFANIRL